ncbi:ZP domain-containing protein [Caerostris extrusa]|uniref:ZP domain-containing protein n=1 Tax=Caerostris extrusa TaxID=172846 RepID=A0AAV4NJT7_CAEEX|nr:ZP domain-containing protein [Caerostris extrusa]
MHCEATSMTAIVKVITPFRGRLYALGHPYECYAVSVRANGEVALTMPLHGRTCGTKICETELECRDRSLAKCILCRNVKRFSHETITTHSF